MMEETKWVISEEHNKERLDKTIVKLHGEWSRTIIQEWAKEGRIEVNGKAAKSNYKVQSGDEVVVYPKEPEEIDIVPENIPLGILYEDDDVIVVNKPRGMVVHPAPGHPGGTLVNALMYHCKDLSGINGEIRPGIVHRIDKDTSGVLVAAKNDKAHEHLSRQLKDKKTERIYKTIVHGNIPHEHGTVDAPIGRDPMDRQKMTVTDINAKDAVTHFNVIERFGNYTFLECRLETGRTHQIRVHLQYIGHAVAGDPKYGHRNTLPISGQALHAARLGFVHPSKEEYMEWEAPMPEDMEGLLDDLRKKS